MDFLRLTDLTRNDVQNIFAVADGLENQSVAPNDLLPNLFHQAPENQKGDSSPL